ncbi:MAG: hypothetical protein WD273_05490 [Trueperaceae bacterium]
MPTSESTLAKELLEAQVAKGNLPLTEVTSAARQLREASEQDPETGRLISRALRTALTVGVDESVAKKEDALREFLLLAHTFHRYVDVWNTALLLDSLRPLEPSERAAQAVSFVALFPGTARAQPQRLEDLVGDISPQLALSILTTWLELIRSTYETSRRIGDLVGDLAAADRIASKLLAKSPDLLRLFDRQWAELAVLAANERQGDGVDRLADLDREARVFARAAVILSHSVDVAEESLSVDLDDKAEALDWDTSLPTPEVLKAVAAGLEARRQRIWVVGRHKDAHKLLGVAKGLGFSAPGEVFEFLDYEQVKNISVAQKLNPAKDAGVIIGAVPHSAKDVGNYSSLVTQIPQEYGIEVVEVRKNNSSAGLATISNGNFRRSLEKLLAKLSVSMPAASAA